VIGGVSHPIFNNTEVYAEYRYVRDSETSFHTAPWSPSTGVGSLASHYAAAANDFIVGLRHTF
jgi:opacity protein-like surface antigen